MIGNKEDIIEWLESKKDWAIFEVTEKREKTLRSIAQNRYYFWVVVNTVSSFHWYTPVETHELLKLTVWLETTTNLEKDEFSFMCNLIRDVWKTKFDVRIPLPNEADLWELEKYLF